MPAHLSAPDRLTDDERAAVSLLASEVERRDGAPPLSDQALTRLASAEVVHLMLTDGASGRSSLTGYAQVDGRNLEVVGDESAAAELLDAALERQPDPLVWSHGNRSSLQQALDARGFVRIRTLHQLRRDAAEPLPDVPLPAGISLRPFAVGRDEDAWLRVNAAAFAHHPEQGEWTADDLRAREEEPWFDPAGFLLAERDGSVIGFHWTKVHEDGNGEVYVLGVDPAAQGLKLGKALLVAGLRLLADRGCPQVLLYVDEDNAAAMQLYERTGFRRFDADSQWRRADVSE